MIKVCFIYDPETNERYLEILSKMTPGRSGTYKNLIGVTKIEEADWCVVVDSTNKDVPLDRTLFLQAHPDGFNYPYGNKEKKFIHRISLADAPSFGEWWLDKSYDELKALPVPNKTKAICCIISNARNVKGHKDRIAFLEKLCKAYPNLIDVYGRIIPSPFDEPNILKCYMGEVKNKNINGYWYGKDDILKDYMFSLEFESIVSPNYFSERVFDSLLMYCKPIVWGCTNLSNHLSYGSTVSIDIYDTEKAIDMILNTVSERNYHECLPDIVDARNDLLDKYQIWAVVHNWLEQHKKENK